MGTVLVLSCLLLIIGIILRQLARDKKAGKSTFCGGDCAHCAGACKTQPLPDQPKATQTHAPR